MNHNLLDERQSDVANALTEWRDAGGSTEIVVLAIQRMILADIRKVFTSFGTDKDK